MYQVNLFACIGRVAPCKCVVFRQVQVNDRYRSIGLTRISTTSQDGLHYPVLYIQT